MRNRYAGTCVTCHQHVAAEAGQRVNEGGRWLTYHDGCRPERFAPAPGEHDGWHQRPLVAFDVESTGVQPLEARIVSAALVGSDGSRRTWLVNPGVPIPAEATERHGITDERVRRAGQPAAVALAEIGTAIGKHLAEGTPLVAYYASYDVTVLTSELARHHLPAPDWAQASIVDPFVLHRQAEPNWRDSMTLGDLCRYYQVRLLHAHDAASDAAAALDLARAIAARHRRLAELAPAELHRAQVSWFAEDARRLQRWYDDKGIAKTVGTEWPLETHRRP